jgi:prepilin peptidase CpaA
MSGWIYAGIAVTAIVSCAWDLRRRRIPNAVTLGSTLAALIAHAADGGSAAVASGAAGWCVGVLLFLPWFALGGMGGGDVKLLGAFGAWLGPAAALRAGLFAMVAGGVMAAGVALHGGFLARSVMDAAGLVSPARGAVRGDRRAPAAIAYALPTAVGVGLALWLR